MRALAPLSFLALLASAGCTREPPATAPVAAVGPDGGAHLDAPPAGAQDIDFVQYNEANDVWRVFVTGRAKTDDPLRLTSVRLARLPQDSTKKAYVVSDGTNAVLWLPGNFHIGYLHVLVAETLDPDTKQPVRVARGNERRLWYPFQVPQNVDTTIFDQPAHYYAPPLTPTGPLYGFGGYGPTRETAMGSYRQANGDLPPGVKNISEGLLLAPPLAAPQPVLGLPDAGPRAAGARRPRNRNVEAVPGSPAAERQAAQRNKQERAALKPRKRGEPLPKAALPAPGTEPKPSSQKPASPPK